MNEPSAGWGVAVMTVCVCIMRKLIRYRTDHESQMESIFIGDDAVYDQIRSQPASDTSQFSAHQPAGLPAESRHRYCVVVVEHRSLNSRGDGKLCWFLNRHHDNAVDDELSISYCGIEAPGLEGSIRSDLSNLNWRNMSTRELHQCQMFLKLEKILHNSDKFKSSVNLYMLVLFSKFTKFL